jgi:Ca-activated chloride channel family protein
MPRSGPTGAVTRGAKVFSTSRSLRAQTAGALDRVYRDLSARFIVERREIELTALFTAAAAVLALAAAGLSTLWLGPVS